MLFVLIVLLLAYRNDDDNDNIGADYVRVFSPGWNLCRLPGLKIQSSSPFISL